ncbi:uncharacterized protein BO97DRAFT_56305 [Aspergillus homomorphus CBS 101889]|uniref:Uncharacterized protein n=1 Tax=Aspergillus homomorphus (strain CBS 101889) TaxID=1450537 RepID=A0A395HWR5_ASPHC|nr:hypothetical protein BO97DRAFT_56305 [Aspergillus homomorphus CBS 101889]RAL12362.1 hypothetical protein BO97DRAFT_56305 [Aspergillus homomorphus CBS 101889]
MTTTIAPAALNVLYYFQKQELKLDFNSPDRAEAYQNLNREGRIYVAEPTAVYLPLALSMSYLRDSNNGLVIGFTTGAEASRWCQTAVLGRLHSPSAPHEVRIRRAWTDEALDQQLQVQQFPLFMPTQGAPPSPPVSTHAHSSSSASTSACASASVKRPSATPGSSPHAQPAVSPSAPPSQQAKGNQPGHRATTRQAMSMQFPPQTAAHLPVPAQLLPAPLTIGTPERAPAPAPEGIERRPRASSFF